MSILTYQHTYAWQQAIELSVHLQTLVEALPAEEQNSLALLVRQSMVDVPAQVGIALANNLPASFDAITKLQSTLTIINNVYPAIDTAEAQTALDDLVSRVISPDMFVELKPQAEPRK